MTTPIQDRIATWEKSLADLDAICAMIDEKLARAQRGALSRRNKTDIADARVHIIQLYQVFEPELRICLESARQAAAATGGGS